MAYTFVNQKTAANATPQTSLTTNSASDFSSNLLIVLVLSTYNNTPSIGDTVNNTYNLLVSISDVAHTHTLYLAYALNVGAGTNATTATSGTASVKGVNVYQYAGIAPSGSLVSWSTLAQNNPGLGANILQSHVFTPNAFPSLMWGGSVDISFLGNSPPQVGTSLSFTGRPATWAALNGGTVACLQGEDVEITTPGSYTPTWGTVAGNQTDSFLSVAAVFTYITQPILYMGQASL